MSEKILKNSKISDIELVPFALKKNDSILKNDYLAWLNDPKVTRLIGSKELYKKEKNLNFIEESFNRFSNETSKGFFIFYIPDKVFIGTSKLDKISNFSKSAEDGIMIGNKEYWGKGLAKKVYKLLLNYAFNELDLIRISGGCNENNKPMIKTFYSLGYQLEGKTRKSDFIDNNFSDHFCFGILREDYFFHNKW